MRKLQPRKAPSSLGRHAYQRNNGPIASVARFPDGRTDIYSGTRFLGSVTFRNGIFVAKDWSGARLGAFDRQQEAAAAVIATK